MSAAEGLREFVSERLTAAAEEIFRVFQRTIVEYEEEIDRQRRLLEVVWKPEIKLHRIELCKQEETLTDQERSSREPPQIKEEVEEVCSSQLELKLESDSVTLTAGSEEPLCNHERNLNLHRDDHEAPQVEQQVEEVRTGHEREQLKLRLDTFVLIPPYEKRDHTEPESDERLLSDAQDGDGHEDSGSTRNAAPKPKPKKRRHKSGRDSDRVYNPDLLERKSNAKTHRKSFQCDTCGKEFNIKSKPDRHVRIHTGEKPCSCDICGKSFSLVSVLSDHVRIHTGENPYLCNTCGREFRHRSALTMHVKAHTGDKPYLCKSCGKAFRVNSSLKRHMRTHTGERPYTCKTCGKGFRQRCHLTAHMTTHTGEKPYLCKVCGKRFSVGSILARHRRLHAGTDP